jgi:hypothetical protein
MDCASLEAESLLLADSHAVHLGDGEAKVVLARPLLGIDRSVVNLVGAEGYRLSHDHVCVGDICAKGGCSQHN